MNTSEAKKVFSDFIRKKNLKATQQREEILDEFLHIDKHITADELYYKVKKKYPKIGYATVYRTLKLINECNLANEIKLGSGKTKFEQKSAGRHHDHLICIKCGIFIEVEEEKIEKSQNKLALNNNFTPTSHKLEIYGFCKNCR
ncbi:MAG: transcriptional repressor [Candidatus Firestonebacteria bacterium]